MKIRIRIDLLLKRIRIPINSKIVKFKTEKFNKRNTTNIALKRYLRLKEDMFTKNSAGVASNVDTDGSIDSPDPLTKGIPKIY